MAKTLEAHDKLIREIFEGSYQFEVPDYQRPYAWTTEQAEELFDDLISAMKESRASGASSQYFLGSIVIIKEDKKPESRVVDGQQRLTTLTILLAALRHIWQEVGYDKGIKSVTPFLYEEGDEMLGKATGYRLTAREEDVDFFRSNIQEPGGIALLIASTDKLEDSRLRYRENATLLLGKAKALPPADLIALWQFLANDCSLVVISTPDLEAAYRIFSVLNNRGLDLAPIDIVKAEVLGLIRTTAGEAKSRDYAKTWSQIEKNLGREDFGNLLAHLRTVYAKQKAKATLLKELQEHVTEYREKRPIDLIDKVIKPYAEVWDFVRDADFEATENAETINEHLSWLNRVDFKDWVPPALVYFKRFRQKPKLLAEFFESLERLTYFLLVTKVGINERIETYAELTKEIELETFKGAQAELTTLALTDVQKRKFVAALDGDVYDDLPKARMALVLRLESLVRAPGVQLQNAVSLEHVLPQTPPDGSDWLQWFPDEDERQAWTHRLANLVPLDRNKNSSASNFDFAKKKNVYFKGKGTASPFVLTQEVRSEDKWTPAMLIDRQNRLVGVLKKHWALEVPPTESVSKAPDTTTAT
ncbi:MAG: DUF262 domain-containing protein [Burkholderiales bacterium]|nr:DUF262 domain-containing protein [Burkholderiales bacterium]